MQFRLWRAAAFVSYPIHVCHFRWNNHATEIWNSYDSPISAVIANFYMEELERKALQTARAE